MTKARHTLRHAGKPGSWPDASGHPRTWSRHSGSGSKQSHTSPGLQHGGCRQCSCCRDRYRSAHTIRKNEHRHKSSDIQQSRAVNHPMTPPRTPAAFTGGLYWLSTCPERTLARPRLQPHATSTGRSPAHSRNAGQFQMQSARNRYPFPSGCVPSPAAAPAVQAGSVASR